jgi:hypothetical protein
MKLLLSLVLTISLIGFSQAQDKNIHTTNFVLTTQQCKQFASDINGISHLWFTTGCVGRSVSVITNIKPSTNATYYKYDIVTTTNYGNIRYAATYPHAFFGEGEFNFPILVTFAKKHSCNSDIFEILTQEQTRVILQNTVNDLVVYDITLSYTTIGTMSVTYYLKNNKQDLLIQPLRWDFNFECDNK